MSIDLVVLLVIASGTAGAVLRFRRRGASGKHLLGATWLAFYGLALTAMMSAHSLEIASHVVGGGSRVAGERWS